MECPIYRTNIFVPQRTVREVRIIEHLYVDGLNNLSNESSSDDEEDRLVIDEDFQTSSDEEQLIINQNDSDAQLAVAEASDIEGIVEDLPAQLNKEDNDEAVLPAVDSTEDREEIDKSATIITTIDSSDSGETDKEHEESDSISEYSEKDSMNDDSEKDDYSENESDTKEKWTTNADLKHNKIQLFVCNSSI